MLGSAGGPRQALPLLGADTFLIVNGDTLTDVDSAALVAAHRGVGRARHAGAGPESISRTIRRRRARRRAARHRLRRAADAGGRSFHFIGVQVGGRRAAFDAARRTSTPADSIGGVYDRAHRRAVPARPRVRHRRRVLGHRHVADYCDDVRGAGGLRHARSAATSPSTPTAHVETSILWDDVEIGAHAVLEDCIVTDGAVVPPGARYRRARSCARCRRRSRRRSIEPHGP